MSDLSFPLRYKTGSVLLVEKVEDITLSQGQHLLSTITGERLLNENFGIPLDIFYHTGIPEILTERIRLAFKQLNNIQATIKIKSYQQGKLSLEISFNVLQQTLAVTFLNG
ncbi:MAG: hypothetical protein KME30_17205 [Iphinoe sp. HA4291-MV1]|jgi:phage baseplate assembly protein W|nr:hypothetical protein [Iphinoe sp. HA4291-MV1]